MLDCIGRGTPVPLSIRDAFGQALYDSIEQARAQSASARAAVKEELDAERQRYLSFLEKRVEQGKLDHAAFCKDLRAEGIVSDSCLLGSTPRPNPWTFQAGAIVQLSGLLGHSTLNGLSGEVVKFDEELQRYHIKLHDPPESSLSIVRARPRNILPCDRLCPHLEPSKPPSVEVSSSNLAVDESEVRYRIRASAGSHTPLHLHGLKIVRHSDGARLVVPSAHTIPDSGSSTVVCGVGDFRRMESELPGSVRRLEESEVSSDAIRLIRGIGGTNAVLFHCEFTLDFGGCLIQVKECPVLHGHTGVLFGNDVAGECRMNFDYTQHNSKAY